MSNKVSWPDAFMFYLSLMRRALLFYVLANIAAAFIFIYPLSLLLGTRQPAPLITMCSLIALVILFFIMVIPVKNTLQVYLYKCCRVKKSREIKPIKQIAAPDHSREIVGGVNTVLRSEKCLAADEYRG
ncbi:MAG: hypothetical protein JRF72_21320 [Deltaproteobacteria bacterium]|jgi:hypothetical protein|nr:hypothetical protein [Deltaproteobacteria bacterium]